MMIKISLCSKELTLYVHATEFLSEHKRNSAISVYDKYYVLPYQNPFTGELAHQETI